MARRMGIASEAAATIGKALVALVVFAAIMLGWQALRARADAREAAQTAASPLPDAAPNGQCALWFIGSSSIHNWRSLDGDMAPWEARNRGISGATLGEIVQRFGNDAPGAAPRAIVFYAGENDIAFGASPQATIAGFEAFLAAKRRRFGAVPVLALSIKPSPTRWHDLPKQRVFNESLRTLAEREDDVRMVDIVPEMLEGGRPGPYFVDDGIHMNAAGYRRWANAVRRDLPNILPDAVVRRCAPAGAGA